MIKKLPPITNGQRTELFALLAEMLPPDPTEIESIQEYSCLAIPAVGSGMMIDFNRATSPKIRVVPAPVECSRLEMEATIVRAVQGTKGKPKRQETSYMLAIEPTVFISEKEFTLNIEIWVKKKRYSYMIENDEALFQSILRKIHKKIIEEWLSQFEQLDSSDLSDILEYQLLYCFFDPDDDSYPSYDEV